MKKSYLITSLGATLLSSAASAATPAASAKTPAPAPQTGSPNFLFILLDDCGWTTFSTPMDKNIPGSCSDYYQSPNLDRLVNSGMRFSSGYAAAAISSPTRHSIQTGMTPARINHIRVGQNTDHIDYPNLLSIPKILKTANPDYICAHFGKWHLDCDPSVMGYDYSDGATTNEQGNQGITSKVCPPGYTPKDKNDTWLFINSSKDPKLVFSVTDRSVKFLEDRTGDKHPFYLQVSYYAMHKEITSTKESYAKFDALPRGEKHTHATFAAMVWDADRAVGQLLGKLHELGLDKNTYIIMMADNGGVAFLPPSKKVAEDKGGYGENTPLQRGKWDLTEGGIRVPFAVAGPGIAANSQCDTPVIAYDIMPTIAQLAGYQRALPDTLDGRSFVGLLRGEAPTGDRDLYFHNPFRPSVGLDRPQSAIREGDWKVLEFLDNGQRELFNLKDDIGEAHDLSKQDPERTKALGDKLDNYLSSVHALKYDPKIPTREVGGSSGHGGD